MRSFNYERIREIMSHPDIFPYITDDGSPDVKDFYPPEDESIYYLLWDGGVYIFMPLNFITYEIHSCVLPEFRGKSLKYVKKANQWMFDNTDCRKINTHVPEFNKRALAYARSAGFSDEGINKKSFLQQGVVYDQYRLGLCQQ